MKTSELLVGIVLGGVATACGANLGQDTTEEVDESLSGTNLIKVVSDKLCLDVAGASTSNGASVNQWTCHGRANQQWSLKGAGTNTFNFVSVNSGKCMEVSGASGANGASVVQAACNGGDNQKWKAVSKGSGQFELHAVHSGKCLDVAGASTSNGAQMQQWTCHGNDNQRFTFSSVGGGTTTGGDSLQFRKANLTNFTSYPDPGSEECIKFNGCMWAGQFAFVDGKQSESWVKSHNILAVHEKDANKYKLKTLRLRQGSHQIDAKVYDECSDSDCDGCCTENASGTGFLIDIEKFTMQRFGSGDGIVEWTCLDCN